MARSTTRRAYFAEVGTRMERIVRDGVRRLQGHRVTSILIVAAAVLGFSLYTVWSILQLPWWLAVAALVGFGSLLGAEAAYEMWRDVQRGAAGGGIVVGGSARSVYSTPIVNPDSFRVVVSGPLEHSEARFLGRSGETRLPHAVRFVRPNSKKFLKREDLPKAIKLRDGLRRHALVVHQFVPGGVMVDDRDLPLIGGIEFEMYLADSLPDG